MKPVLCGGTFLTLLSYVKKQDTRKKLVFREEIYTSSDKNLVIALLRMMNPAHKVEYTDSIDQLISRYKNCKRPNCAEVPVNQGEYAPPFHRMIERRSPELFSGMEAYMHTFLRTNEPEQMEWLGNALMEILVQDDNTANYEFWLDADGQFVSREGLLAEKAICLPLLIMCIWDYIAAHVPNNQVGKDTVVYWTKTKAIPNDKGELKQGIGMSVRGKYQYVLTVPTKETNKQSSASVPNTAVPDNLSVSKSIESSSQSTQIPMTQNVYGGMVISPGAQIGNINYFNQSSSGGTSLFEMQSLCTDSYNLIVLESEMLEDQHFSMAKSCIFTEGTDPQDRQWLLKMNDDAKQALTSTPALFIMKMKRNITRQNQLAVIGRITGFHIQKHEMRIEWKYFCTVPQELIVNHCSEFGIYYCALSTELDEEHWAFKRIPLFEKLSTYGYNPLQL